MTIITPITGGAGVVPLGALARGHHTVRSRVLAGEAGEFAGGWAEADLYLPEWVQPDATLDLDFLGWQAYAEPAGQGYGGAISTPEASPTVFDRNSEAGRFTSAGAYEAAAADVLRRDYDPATLAARGALIEAAVAYAGVNGLLSGAVAGSPGTLPTGWVSNSGAVTGLTRAITIGATLGIPWIEIRYSGTADGSTDNIRVFTVAAGIVAAVNAQVWATGAYIVTPADTGLSDLNIRTWMYSSASALLAGLDTSIYATRATWGRRSGVHTLNQASTASIRQVIETNLIAPGVTVDISIRIGLPTLTQTPYLPSPFAVGTSAATRLADTLTIPFGSWGTQGQGGLYVELVPNITGADQTFARFDDGTSNNAIYIGMNGAGAIFGVIIAGGVSQAVLGLGTYAGGVLKAALAWAANDFAARRNGGSLVTDASGSVPSGLTTLRIGSSIGVGYQSGHTQRVTVYPTRAIATNALIGSLVA